MYDAENLVKLLCRYKKNIKELIYKQEFDAALSMISLSANLLYISNLYYMDEDLENNLAEISKILELRNQIGVCNSKNVIVFYDGFGLNTRGLAQIYLKALCKNKKVFYITHERNKNNIPDINKILTLYSGESFYIKEESLTGKINQLANLINNIQPSHFFFYSLPNDVVATTLLYAMEGQVLRYQINLTDHAFWLGAKCFDTCIEFRDLGANISYEYRKIEKETIRIIPYYPIIDYQIDFKGFPFPVKENQRVVFSGGSFYKTLDKNDTYFQIVDHLLSNHPDVIFWYAGNGSISERKVIDKILMRYPERAFLTQEREDLYQILQNCCFYLSTYPLAGGLMYQYSAKANKIPLTLYFNEYSRGCLIDQDELEIGFYSFNELKEEMDKLLSDIDYRTKKEAALSNAVISEEEFTNEIIKAIEGNKSNHNINWHDVDTLHFRQLYLGKFSNEEMNKIISHYGWHACKASPIRFFKGILIRTKTKIKRFIYK